jgi:hypothetical protein
MEEFTEGTSSEGISRRTVIKRAGVVGAVAWTAPVLSSMGAKAFAGTPAACASCAECPQPSCGADCGCLTDVGTGDCFCHQFSFCDQLPACADSSTCPDGWVCAVSCCPGGSFCHPPCGVDAGIGAQGAGARSGG